MTEENRLANQHVQHSLPEPRMSLSFSAQVRFLITLLQPSARAYVGAGKHFLATPTCFHNVGRVHKCLTLAARPYSRERFDCRRGNGGATSIWKRRLSTSVSNKRS